MKRNKEMPMPLAATMGAGCSLLVTLAGAAVFGWLIGSGSVGKDRVDLLAGVTTVLSAFAGCILASALLGKMRMQVSLIAASGYLAVLFALTALMFGGQFEGIPLAIGCVAAGALASLLPMFMAGKGRGSRRPKRRYR